MVKHIVMVLNMMTKQLLVNGFIHLLLVVKKSKFCFFAMKMVLELMKKVFQKVLIRKKALLKTDFSYPYVHN